MEKGDAKTRVQIWVSDYFRWAQRMPQIVDYRTREYDFGWVFFFRRPDRPYPPKIEEVTGGEFPPVVIDRRDGSIQFWTERLALRYLS